MLNFDLLFRLRLVVARFGEMDLAKWWNSKGQLGSLGAKAVGRGFPRTHYFAQARSVFAVASHRCAEVSDFPGSVTLWRLPEDVEEEFEAHWEIWLDHGGEWKTFFEKVATIHGTDLVAILRSFELLTDGAMESYTKLRRSAEGRAVPLPGVFGGSDNDIALLAIGFGRGEQGALAVPYAKRADI